MRIVEMTMMTTIEQLEGHVWPEPEWQASLVSTAHALRKKPISELTPNDLRVAFNENIGTVFLQSRVLEVLTKDPIAGDLYEGDLIISVLQSVFFKQNPAFQLLIRHCAAPATELLENPETKADVQRLCS